MFKTPITILTVALSGITPLIADTTADAPPPSQEEIFDVQKIWNIHLSFTLENWEAMEPKAGPRLGRRPNRSFLTGPEGGRNGIAAVLGYEFPEVHATLEFDDHHFHDVSVRYKGNGTFLSSRESLKRSFKIDLNDYVKGQRLAGISQINLHNSVRDPSHMNEPLAYKLYRDARIPSPRTAYARLYITVPGKYDRKYFGLFNMVEDVGPPFVKANFEASDGALFKPVTSNLFSDMGSEWSDYKQTYDPKGKLSEEQANRLIATCKFFSESSDADFAARVSDYVDLDNFARYLAITVWLSDMDGILGPGQNYYIYLHPTSNKFMFIPWDQDQSFGQFPRGSQEQREQLSIHKPWNESNPFFEKMFEVKPFKSRYLAALKDINETIVQADQISQLIRELANILGEPVGEESADRLAELNKAASGETITTIMTGGRSRLIETKPIKMFIPRRQASIGDQIAGRSQGVTTDRGSRRRR